MSFVRILLKPLIYNISKLASSCLLRYAKPKSIDGIVISNICNSSDVA